jgi:hypothetical protein
MLAAALRGDLASQRAAILLAVIAGVQVMLQMIGLSALADADPDDLKTILTPVFEQLLTEARRSEDLPGS